MFHKRYCLFIGILVVLGLVNATNPSKRFKKKRAFAVRNTALFEKNYNCHKKDVALVRGGDSSTTAPVATTASAPPATITSKTRTTTTKYAVTSGILLAFNSGFMNGCFLSGAIAPDGTKQAVSAVTGAWTTSAVGLANGNYDQFRFQLNVILSYITGSTTASIINPFPKPFELYLNKYGISFLVCAVLVTLASYIATNTKPGDTRAFFYLAAIANGLQNSLTSTHTSNLCRTAHFSGISSDIGTFLGQVLRGNTANLLKLKVFVGLGVAFFMGGFLSFFTTQQFQCQSLLFSAVLYLGIGVSFLLQK